MPPDKHGRNKGKGVQGVPPVENRWKPGQSGNPNGRPKKKTLSERIAALLDRADLPGVSVDPAVGESAADALALSIVQGAVAGKFPFAKEILDRLEGKVPDRLIDETPHANPERDRNTVAGVLAALRERGGIAAAPNGDGATEPGGLRNGRE